MIDGVRSAWNAAWYAGAIVTAVLLTGCTVSADGLAVPAADLGIAPQPVPVGALDRFLLPPEQLNSLVGTKALFVEKSFSNMYGGNTAASDCAAAGLVPWGPAYDGSGWTAVRAQYLQEMRLDGSFENKTWQAVVSFPLPVDAAAFYSEQVASWRTCDGRRVNKRDLDDPEDTDNFWTLSDSTNVNGMLSIVQYQDDGDDWACQNALTIRNNVAVNVLACGNGVKTQAVDVAAAIVKKIPVE